MGPSFPFTHSGTLLYITKRTLSLFYSKDGYRNLVNWKHCQRFPIKCLSLEGGCQVEKRSPPLVPPSLPLSNLAASGKYNSLSFARQLFQWLPSRLSEMYDFRTLQQITNLPYFILYEWSTILHVLPYHEFKSSVSLIRDKVEEFQTPTIEPCSQWMNL